MLAHPRAHTLTHKHSLTNSLTHSLTHSHTHKHTYTHSLTNHSLTFIFTEINLVYGFQRAKEKREKSIRNLPECVILEKEFGMKV